MCWLVLAQGLSEQAAAALKAMSDSSSSEGAAVAECLNGIAENGDGSETDEHLLACAQEILGWATWFISQMGGAPELRDGDFSTKENRL